ncbi:hypothetical protein AMTR_s00153p00063480 [Amborella trichopoda]|uniref:Uncharacterized protein n=1 Tax=Amborella trichopoda TaxID=13333 RepID=W1PG64_AMBTC|nr:hypothetical protein AMTR_s00153p00063480 [Amborella trichopoda]
MRERRHRQANFRIDPEDSRVDPGGRFLILCRNPVFDIVQEQARPSRFPCRPGSPVFDIVQEPVLASRFPCRPGRFRVDAPLVLSIMSGLPVSTWEPGFRYCVGSSFRYYAGTGTCKPILESSREPDF